jgi:F-type H+-transporting ATPase subunit a
VLIFAFLFLMPIMAGVFLLPFVLETFVGFIQAVIFAALTLIFATLATESHEGHEEGAADH